MGLWTLLYLLTLLADDPKDRKPEPAIEKNVAAARSELNLQGVTDAVRAKAGATRISSSIPSITTR